LERFLFYIDSKRVVNVKCSFWDYKYGWVGNIHGYVFFRKNKVRKLFNEGQILLYMLRRDATYSMWLWFYFPFKSEKDELSKYKTH
jgi:hypothetical protein